MPGKPTIFFSHSSRDSAILTRLRELLVWKTGRTVDVFLSSDGQSIPLGRNWVHALQSALEQASLVLVFVSPQSLKSDWMFFESGFTYAKGIRVIPIGFLGVDLGTLPPPIGLLQGFNISSAEGLNNIIALVNQEFGYEHKERFTEAEYQELQDLASRIGGSLGNHARLIDSLYLTARPERQYFELHELQEDIVGILSQSNVELDVNDWTIISYGLTISIENPYSDRGWWVAHISIDPSVADTAFPLVTEILRKLVKDGTDGAIIAVTFSSVVKALPSQHKITASLAKSPASLAGGYWMAVGELDFKIDLEREGDTREFPLRVFIRNNSSAISVIELGRLIDFLFERGVLFLSVK